MNRKIKMTKEMTRKHKAVEQKLLQGIDPERYKNKRLFWAVAAALQAEKRMHGDYSPLTIRELAAAVKGQTREELESAVDFFRDM